LLFGARVWFPPVFLPPKRAGRGGVSKSGGVRRGGNLSHHQHAAMLLLAPLFFCVSSHAHAVFSYAEAGSMLHAWVPESSAFRTHFLFRVLHARTLIAESADGGGAANSIAVLQADGGGYNLFLIEGDEERRASTVRACIWYKEGRGTSRHVSFRHLRSWFDDVSADGWSLGFDAPPTSDKFEWAYDIDV